MAIPGAYHSPLESPCHGGNVRYFWVLCQDDLPCCYPFYCIAGLTTNYYIDVMTVEPLPKDSPLWELGNVLLSPHNMDMTLTFMKESMEFFIAENLPRFIRGETLLNHVDKSAGYLWVT